MLPIYEAIDFIGVIGENVGHTKPWIVLANTPQGLTSFVVKLYSSAQVEQFHCVSKEIFCNLLAHEFDLLAPSCALIDIPENISLKAPPDAQQQFDSADHRLKFATVYLKNVKTALPELSKTAFKSRISLDTLYAFDNLIRNSDRGHPKANLLIGSKAAYLIDHELTLATKDIANIALNTLQLEDRFTKYHLLYSFLKKAKGPTKRNFFNDFSFYLNDLSMNRFTPYFNQLVNEGFSDYSQPICEWVNQVKENCNTFVNLLRGSVQ